MYASGWLLCGVLIDKCQCKGSVNLLYSVYKDAFMSIFYVTFISLHLVHVDHVVLPFSLGYLIGILKHFHISAIFFLFIVFIKV